MHQLFSSQAPGFSSARMVAGTSGCTWCQRRAERSSQPFNSPRRCKAASCAVKAVGVGAIKDESAASCTSLSRTPKAAAFGVRDNDVHEAADSSLMAPTPTAFTAHDAALQRLGEL